MDTAQENERMIALYSRNYYQTHAGGQTFARDRVHVGKEIEDLYQWTEASVVSLHEDNDTVKGA